MPLVALVVLLLPVVALVVLGVVVVLLRPGRAAVQQQNHSTHPVSSHSLGCWMQQHMHTTRPAHTARGAKHTPSTCRHTCLVDLFDLLV
jgi:hypothetical protein